MSCPFAFHYHDNLPPRLSSWSLTKETGRVDSGNCHFLLFFTSKEVIPTNLSVILTHCTHSSHQKSYKIFTGRRRFHYFFFINPLRFCVIFVCSLVCFYWKHSFPFNLAWADWYSRPQRVRSINLTFKSL